MSEFSVTFHAHPAKAWSFRNLATPFVRIDSEVWQCSWDSPTTVNVQPGGHCVETFIRYKRRHRDHSLGEGNFHAPAAGTVSIEAANTWANQSAFMPHLVSS